MNKEKAVVFENVSKTIGKKEILKDVSFDVNKGEVVGIIGDNGAGKTTILRLASGLSYASGGNVFIDGKKIFSGITGGLPSDVGILIESPKFLENLTGFQNFYLLSKIQKIIDAAKVEETIKLVGLSPKDKKKVREYSLGMKQRLGIAQAIMESPSLILFDEPTNALDKEGMILFDEIIRTYKEAGSAFIFVSHSMEEILRYCDRVYKLEKMTLCLKNKDSLYH